jgi:hypothetical protein
MHAGQLELRMTTEALPTSNGFVLAPRAAIAQLTLQLRAAMHEVAAAEVDHDSIDQEAAVSQLRARLAPLMDARRRTLDEALATAEVEAATAVAAARLEAESIVAGLASVEPVEVVTTLAEENGVEVSSISAYDEMSPDEPTAVELYQSPAPGAPTINIVIDAEAFARVIASVLGEHLTAPRATAPDTHVAPKPSMKHARHLDVFLVGLATLIVLVILAAWIG